MFIHKTPFWLKLIYPGLTWDHYGSQKKIFLTFDDGPVPEVTPFVLETLHQFEAKATFFCVGENVVKHPEVFEQVVEAGHSWGNHTYNHLNGWKTPDNEYMENIARCQDVLSSGSGVPLFRPPYGRIRRSQIRELQKSYQIIMWDLLTGDFDSRIPSEKCLEKSIRFTRSGSIVIFHDSYKTQETLEYVLPRYLEFFRSRDYQFLPL